VVDDLSFDFIDEVEASWLQREFEEREVWEVVKGLNGDKEPNPNGSLWHSSKLVGLF
jgi:hypothetical protein